MLKQVQKVFSIFFNKANYTVFQVFLGKNQNNIFITLNAALFLISAAIFFSKPIVVIVGSIIWWDLYAFTYILCLLKVPVVPVLITPFIIYKVLNLILLYGSIINFIFLYCILVIALSIYNTIISKNVKTYLQVFKVDQTTIKTHFESDFYNFSVLLAQCQIFLFFFCFLCWQSENTVFEFIGSFKGEDAVLLYFFLFILFGSMFMIFFIENVIVHFFNTEVLGLGSKLWTMTKYGGTLFLGLQATDQFMMNVAHHIPMLQPIVDNYRIRRTGLYTYHFPIEYSNAQRYQAITKSPPPLIVGTSKVNTLLVDYTLAQFDGVKSRHVEQMNNLVAGPYTPLDLINLAKKQLLEYENFVSTVSSSEQILKDAADKVALNKKGLPGPSYIEWHINKDGEVVWGHLEKDGTYIFTKVKPPQPGK